jgi:catechol 2,3-dioxygenase-like lactoylglutathione lyase family enzyme
MGLDHVVVMVDDLAKGIEQYAARGFTVTPGGEHTHGNTHNALITLDDDIYLELIAFRVAHATPHRWERFRAFPGVIDYCLGYPSVSEAVRAINARGLPYPAGAETGRLRPDGVELRWRSSQLADQERGLPFLIEDVTPRSLRVPGGPAARHANGAMGVAQLVVLVPDLARARTDFRALLGSEGRTDGSVILFDLGGVALRVATPVPASAEGRLLAARGAGPWRLTLKQRDGSGIVL